MDLNVAYDPECVTVLHQFIQKRVEITKASKLVIGLSGGLDSSTVVKLAADALGPEKVLTLLLPVKETTDTQDGKNVAEACGVEWKLVDLEKDFNDLLGTYTSSLGLEPDQLPRLTPGNLSSRLRMATLYFAANALGGIVLGTSNKTELLTGYFTKYGDGSTDAMPLGDLYKTQVFSLAEDIGVPDFVIKKKPTAGFFQGQTDEDELGISYPLLDQVLRGLELRLTVEEIAGYLSLSVKEVSRIETMVHRSAHKRFLGAIPKLGIRTPGFDWRENVDFGLE
jgi:NAD+ synthase